MKTTLCRFFFTSLIAVSGCQSEARNPFLQQALHAKKPITLRIGYVPGAEPPLQIEWGKGSPEQLRVNVLDFVCNSVRALFPEKECQAPHSLPEMTQLSTFLAGHKHYTVDQIFDLAEWLPGEEDDARFVIVDGDEAEARCTHEKTCSLGSTPTRARGTVVAIFMPAIIRNSPSSGFIAQTLAVTMVHEFGHYAGLVNISVPMVTPHLTETGPDRHCNNPNCILYGINGNSAASTWNSSYLKWITDRLKNGEAADVAFDENCRNDVRAASTYR